MIETNPLFASYGNFISSDYMLSRLNLDPALTQKRLGDAFYEQKLVSDQITSLTGRKFLPGYTSEEAEFIALMEQGLSEARAQNLIPGVALTRAQVAALTHDIVWMVSREVTLPNGTTEQLLVPQVFLTRLHAKDLRPNGSLIAAQNINIKTSDTLQNSGTILGSKSTTLNATDILNQGIIKSDGDTRLNASNDINNQSGTISGVRVALLAGHDIINETSTEELQLGNIYTTRIRDTASITATDSLDIEAGNNITVTAANIESGGNTSIKAGNNLTIQAKAASESASIAPGSGASGGSSQTVQLTSQVKTGGNLSLQAKNDIKLAVARINAEHKLYIAAKNIHITAAKNIEQSSFNGYGLTQRKYDEEVVGGVLQAGGDITIRGQRTDNTLSPTPSPAGGRGGSAAEGEGNFGSEGGNINLESASIKSRNGNLSLIADGDINLTTLAQKHESFSETNSSSKKRLTTTQRTERNETWRTDAIGNSLSGDNVRLTSGRDINITGSDINASKDLTLGAMNDINITAATNSYGSEQFSHKQTSGWQITSDFNITNKGPEVTRKAREDGTKQSYSRSSLTSGDGNLSIMAGGNLIASGTDLSARTGDLALIAGGTVALLAGQDTLSQESSTITVTKTSLNSQQRHGITDSYDSLTYQGSTVQGNKVTVSSGEDIVLQAAQVSAGEGGIILDAGSDIKLLAAINSSSRKHTENLDTDGPLAGFAGIPDALGDRSKDSKTESQYQTAQVSSLKSAAGITTHSGRDTLIEASVLNATGAINLSAGNKTTYNPDGSIKTEGTKGKIIFAAVKETSYFSEEDKTSSRVWQSQSGSGNYTDTLKLANINAGGGFSTSATGGIVIDIPSVPVPPPVEAAEQEITEPVISYDEQGNPREKLPLTAEQETAQAEEAAAQAVIAAAAHKLDEEKRYHEHIQNMVSQPGQEWIGQLVKQAKTKPDLLKIQQVAAAAENWDYKAEGLTQEAAVVVVLVVTFFTAGTGGPAAAAGTAVGTAAGGSVVVAAAVTAGLTSLATQAALSFINNKGDVGKTLTDLSKEEKVKAVITAMITAGALEYLNGFSFMSTIKEYNAQSEYYQQLQKNLINNTASTLVNHAINGGDLQQQLEQSLKSAFIDTGAAQGANWIGDMKADDTLNTYTHKLAHAIAGCAAGMAKSDDCRSGALGAVVGEISAELYGGNRTNANNLDLPAFKTDTVNFARMMAGIAAAITGNDVNLAASAGGNAAENNYLSHKENEDRLEAARGCDNGNTEACDKRDVLNALDKERDAKLNLACQGNPNSEGCIGVTIDMRDQLATYFQTENGVQLKDNVLSVEDQKDGLGNYTAKSELQSYVDLLKVSNQKTEAVQSYDNPAKSPDSYNSDPYGVMSPGNPDLYMVVKVGGQWGAVGKSDKVDTSVAGVNGISNETNYAPGLMGSHVEKEFKTSSLYTLYYNPTKGFLSDGWETFMDKLGFTTPVTKQFSQVLSDVQIRGKNVSWVAHSQGGPIFAEAVRFNGGDLSKNSVAFHSGANNKWVTDYILDRANINKQYPDQKTKYHNSPFDFVPNVIGLNGNLLEMLGSTVAIPLLFMGPAVSPHTLPYVPAQPSTLSQGETP